MSAPVSTSNCEQLVPDSDQPQDVPDASTTSNTTPTTVTVNAAPDDAAAATASSWHVRYTYELLPHIQCLQLSLLVPRTYAHSIPQIRADTTSIHCSWQQHQHDDSNHDDGGAADGKASLQPPTDIQLPLPSDCASVQVSRVLVIGDATPNESCIDIRFSYTQKPADLSDWKYQRYPIPPLSALSSLWCKECNTSLLLDRTDASFVPLDRILAMPSEHWKELADMWLCHGGKGNHHLNSLLRHEIKATAARCLIADTFIMLHASFVDRTRFALTQEALDEVRSSTLALENGSTSLPGSKWQMRTLRIPGWYPIKCKTCDNVVGLADIEQASTLQLQLLSDEDATSGCAGW